MWCWCGRKSKSLTQRAQKTPRTPRRISRQDAKNAKPRFFLGLAFFASWRADFPGAIMAAVCYGGVAGTVKVGSTSNVLVGVGDTVGVDSVSYTIGANAWPTGVTEGGKGGEGGTVEVGSTSSVLVGEGDTVGVDSVSYTIGANAWPTGVTEGGKGGEGGTVTVASTVP